jgi:hypothetical protein
MDTSSNFYVDPRGFDIQDLNTGIAAIQLTRPGGQSMALDLASTSLVIQHEHPPVDRMEGDLGAICQVFKESSNYFLTLRGVKLAPGDQVTLSYHHQSFTATLRVLDLEHGRYRIAPPLVLPSRFD